MGRCVTDGLDFFVDDGRFLVGVALAADSGLEFVDDTTTETGGRRLRVSGGTTGTAWTAWSPAISQGGSVARTVVEASYVRQGRLITANFTVTLTAAGTPDDPITCTLPVAAKYVAAKTIGAFRGLDTGTEYHVGVAELTAGTQMSFLIEGATAYIGADPTWTLASGDTLSATVTYEAAA